MAGPQPSNEKKTEIEYHGVICSQEQRCLQCLEPVSSVSLFFFCFGRRCVRCRWQFLDSAIEGDPRSKRETFALAPSASVQYYGGSGPFGPKESKDQSAAKRDRL